MFRFARPRRNLFSMSRLPLKVESSAQRGEIQIQKVRFWKPRFQYRSFAITCMTIYVGLSIYNQVVFKPLDRAVGEAAKNLPEEEEEEGEEFGSLFIPFPGTTKELRPQPYRGSDPEWQDFIKFSKDHELGKKIRTELAQFVRQLADKHPVLKLRCGKGMKLRRYWLDIDFPTHPPPEFERSGIEIGDDFVAWSTMPVESETVFRLRQILWPSALAQSIWAFTKVMVSDDSRRLARFLGLQGVAAPPTVEQILTQHQAHFNGNGTPTEAGSPKPSKAQAITESQKAMATTPIPEKTSITGQDAETDAERISKIGLSFQAHFFRGIFAFKEKFKQTWKPALNYPPRGSILVSGLVELDSPKAWLVFDVKAAWDPKTKSYDPRSMQLNMRRLQLKKQAALGGP